MTSSSTNKNKTQKPPIDDFNGYYQFLNNDYPTWIQFQGLQFPNITTAFQAARTSNIQLRKKISLIENYDQFKSVVSSIKNPENWYSSRYKVMQKLIRDKFKRNKQIANKLAGTQQRKLYNCYKTSGQNQLYWGCIKQSSQSSSSSQVQYKGTNNLGKILEIVRADIIKFQDTQKWIQFQNLQQDPELFPQTCLIVNKDNTAIDKLLLQNSNYFLFGSHPKCAFRLEHPSISKFHAAIYFSQLQVIIVDVNSTHGTFVIRSNSNKDSKDNKQKLQPLQKRTLNNGDIIVFGLSSRTYVCNINFEKLQVALKRKQQEIEKNVKKLSQVNTINGNMDKQEIKSKIGYKRYQGIYVQNIDQHYSYNDIKQLFKKYGPVEKIRMIQNYKNMKFQGEVIVIYESRTKIQDIIKDIKQSNDKEIQKMALIPIDKYDIDKILEKNKEGRDKQRQKDKDRQFQRQREKHRDERDRRRSRSRQKQRKQKHKKYEKDDNYERSERKRDR